MSDREKAPARAEVAAPPLPPAPSRRAKLVAALLGLLLLGGGAWLLWVFAEDPSGELPWLPGTWKGAPLILGACFGGVYGALLLILRRFSLRGMLLCSILSAALAGGLTAYVQTITHINEVQACLEVPKRYHQTVIRHATERATQERILAFLEALQAAGKLKGVSELNSVSVAFNPNPNQEELQWRIDFEYLTFVHRPASSVRQAAEKYVKYLVKMSFNLAWREEKRMKKERNLRSISPSKYELLPICWYLEELVFWEPMYNFEVDVSEVKFLVPCSDHPTLESRFDQNMKINVLAAVGKAYARRAQWLIEQETDDWIASKLKELQAAALDENVEYESKFYDVIQEQFRSSPPFQPIIGEEGVVE